MIQPSEKPLVIVVSSHVASGTVGNRAAVFALERLGFPVVAVPTVALAWHPGRGSATRILPPRDEFASLIADLAGAPWLGAVGGVLSGYFGAVEQVEPVAALVDAVKAGNPDALYLCDPVLGDANGTYVSEAIVDATRDALLPLADIVTPNRYELGFLSGEIAPDNEALIAEALATGVNEVVVTSAFAAPEGAANLLLTPDGMHIATHPAARKAPHGTGDLLAALYLAHRLSGVAAQGALRQAAGAIYRLVELAAGAEDLPLAAGQEMFFDRGETVALNQLT
jgi:pyridoxine kinase